MGQGASTGQIRAQGHALLLEKTKTTRTIIDYILKYMLHELKVRDLYLMASPSECKKYVLAAANTLLSHFEEFRIAPSMDKRGIIAFRSVKDLTEPSSAEKKERHVLCLHIAFFYVRIFQIYGALAMTLLDDVWSGEYTSYGQYGMQQGIDKSRLSQHGFLAQRGSQPLHRFGGDGDSFTDDSFTDDSLSSGSLSGSLSGGGVEKPRDLQYFIFMNPILFDTFGGRYRVNIPGPWKSITFRKNSGYSDKQSGSLTIYITERKSFDIGITASLIGDKILLEFNSIKYSTLPTFTIREKIDKGSITDIDKDDLRYRFSQKSDSSWVSDAPVQDIFVKVLEPIYDYIKRKGTDTDNEDDYRDDYRRRREIGRDDYGRYVKREDNYGASSGFIEKDGVDEHLKLQRLVASLTKRDKPFAHCVSRALQLLKTPPLGNYPVESNICNPKFLEDRSSIPGGDLSRSIGIATLSNLFYDVIDGSSPGLTRSSAATQQHIEFMRVMSARFGSGKEKIDEKGRLSIITTAGRDRELCGKAPSGTPIQVPAKDAARVYGAVNELFKYQLEHSAKCMMILNQLFVIKSDARGINVHIHPNVFKGGNQEINRISNNARILLTQYYSNCETIYMSGATVAMKAVSDVETAKRDAEKAAKAPEDAARGVPPKPAINPTRNAKPAAPLRNATRRVRFR